MFVLNHFYRTQCRYAYQAHTSDDEHTIILRTEELRLQLEEKSRIIAQHEAKIVTMTNSLTEAEKDKQAQELEKEKWKAKTKELENEIKELRQQQQHAQLPQQIPQQAEIMRPSSEIGNQQHHSSQPVSTTIWKKVLLQVSIIYVTSARPESASSAPTEHRGD